jgi:hypothetical protein
MGKWFNLAASMIILAFFSCFFMATSKKEIPYDPKEYMVGDSIRKFPDVRYAYLQGGDSTTLVFSSRPIPFAYAIFADSVCRTLRHFNFNYMKLVIIRYDSAAANFPGRDTLYKKNCF